MKWPILILFLATLIKAHASVKIEDVSVLDQGKNSGIKIGIKLSDALNSTPRLLVRDNIVQIELDQTDVWPKIEKKVTVEKSFDTTLMAYQFDRGTSRIRTILPYNAENLLKDIKFTLSKNEVFLNIPSRSTAKVVETPAFHPSNNNYDEKLLDNLLKDKLVDAKDDSKNSEKTEDEVKTFLSSVKDKPKMGGNNGVLQMGSYVGKFMIFLVVVLGLFYFMAIIFKKGMIKKGKLGFLSKTTAVEVLSTTYIGPKRSVLMIRAHDQLFLIGNSEKGIDFLSEVKDMNGVFKKSEKEISGFNFDGTLQNSVSENKEFKLKENIQLSDNYALNALDKQESNKFSNHIKDKLKKLKPLKKEPQTYV